MALGLHVDEANQMRSLFACCSVIASVLLPLQACAQLMYSAKAIQGKVVDAETGLPLEGVHIVAQWRIDRAFVGDDKALLHVSEAVTGKDGSYSFMAWGPITLPPRADFGQGEDPSLSIFKSGYEPAFLTNEVVSNIFYRRTPLGESRWNASTTKLQKWKGDLKTYAVKVRSMAGGLPYRSGVEWKNYPKMLMALVDEERNLKDRGYQFSVSVPGVYVDQFSKEDLDYLNAHAR